MPNITIELTKSTSSAQPNVSFPFSNVAIVGSSCKETNQCSSYKAILPRGAYAFDCFGASGINIDNGCSHGGHTYGTINLLKKTIFYLNVGQQGQFNGDATYGGGGKGNKYSWAGGGATDIRLIDDDHFEGLKSRIMVAAGGGGYSLYHDNAHRTEGNANAGGLEGEDGFIAYKEDGTTLETSAAKGGTQFIGGEGGISPEGEDDYLLSEERNGTYGKGGSTDYGSGGGGGG